MVEVVKNKDLKWLVLLGAALVAAGCSSGPEDSGTPLFEEIPSSSSNISFSNDLAYNESFNIYTYKDFYAGGGVGLGDINNDGLLDIYLTANQEPNRLYLNKGDFEFEDITDQAGVAGSKPWSNGVSMVDINGDGLLDIYVANAGATEGEDRKNELFVNNGDLTFTERAEEFGIADSGYSIHAAFFDYDNDGDLDMYLLNNYASKSIGRYNLQTLRREQPNFEGGDRFYRNEGGSFVDVTEEAGIFSSEAGFGLGVSVGDIDRDGWMDIYVSNDFFERDYLYLNNRDGTFREVLEEKLSSISTTSMGGDIADLDNDGFSEIFVADMLPETEERLKTVGDFLDWNRYRAEVEMGYHRKFARNTLQYNNGDGTFSEIGRYAGVEATDWSWGAMIADFDLDGLRDIFVPNGFYKDVTDKDHLMEMNRLARQQGGRPPGYEQLVEMTPTIPLPNYLFKNQGELQFENRAEEWGVGRPGFSNGAAYGDLDNDGDLDLVVNNVNMEADLYRNRSVESAPDSNGSTGWLQLQLRGEAPNTIGVGAQVGLTAGDRHWYAEQMPQRGFQSSVDPVIHFGLGPDLSHIDTIRVRWPDGRVSLQTDVETGQRIELHQQEARQEEVPANGNRSESGSESAILADVSEGLTPEWRHQESAYNDFEQSPLLFHMRSTEGPPICSGDIDGDGTSELYAGGARGQAGALLRQNSEGRFEQTSQPALQADRESEDTDCIFFDADGDGHLELYVASGSSEYPVGDRHLADRLYRLDQEENLVRMNDALPRPRNGYFPTGAVAAADLDGDGDQDLFIGARMTPAGGGAALGYGVPVGGYLLENDGTGQFEDATDRRAPGLQARELNAAGITDAVWGDLNGDDTPDLALAGEWMPLTIFFNDEGELERADPASVGLEHTSGWWQSLALTDLNGDGALDLVAGNHGLNSRFRASPEYPLEMWAGDFDRDGKIEQIFSSFNDGEGPYPLALYQNILQELPYLRSRYSTFREYSEQTIRDIFTDEQLQEAKYYRAEQLASVFGLNDGQGNFELHPLPNRAQWTPAYAILPEDLNTDALPELVLGGNLDAAQHQAGPYDAGYGTVLRRDHSGGYHFISSRESGFFVQGDIRSIEALSLDGEEFIVVGLNNGALQFFKKEGKY